MNDMNDMNDIGGILGGGCFIAKVRPGEVGQSGQGGQAKLSNYVK